MRTCVRSSGSNCRSLTKIVQPPADPGVCDDVGGFASGEIAMLVLEHAVQNKELFAAAMRMGGEARPGCVADDRGGPGDLLADAVQHMALDAGNRRRRPGKLRCV